MESGIWIRQRLLEVHYGVTRPVSQSDGFSSPLRRVMLLGFFTSVGNFRDHEMSDVFGILRTLAFNCLKIGLIG